MTLGRHGELAIGENMVAAADFTASLRRELATLGAAGKEDVIVVVRADPVREDEEHPVVMRPGRQPAHDPLPPLRPEDLTPRRFRLLGAPRPGKDVGRRGVAKG